MKFLKIQIRGLFNSFRLPDYHTYHKTLPLPPKTTIGGMLGAALGISPQEVNEQWLLNQRFKVGVVGNSVSTFKDLWQIRKYTDKQIKAYSKKEVDLPWYTSVIVREINFQTEIVFYFSFLNEADLTLVYEKFQNPSWALSLGREDELIQIQSISLIELAEQTGQGTFSHTILPFDVFGAKFKTTAAEIKNIKNKNLLDAAPTVVNLPTQFEYEGETRKANEYKMYSFVSDLAMTGFSEQFFSDNLNENESIAFQLL